MGKISSIVFIFFPICTIAALLIAFPTYKEWIALGVMTPMDGLILA